MVSNIYIYMQSITPLTTLLTTPKQEAFWCLVQICEQYLPGYYSPGLVGMCVQLPSLTPHHCCCSSVQHAFQIDAMILKDLLAKYIPDTNAFMDVCISSLCAAVLITAHPLLPSVQGTRNRHIQRNGPYPVLHRVVHEHLFKVCHTQPPITTPTTFVYMHSLWAQPTMQGIWAYNVIYCRTLPWPMVLRVWDMFFFEGVKVLFKVAVAVLYLTFHTEEDRRECKG